MTKVLIAVVLTCVMSSAVRADDDEDPPPKAGKDEAPAKSTAAEDDDAPTTKTTKSSASASVSASSGELVAASSPKARMTLPGGKLLFGVIGEANMAKSAVGKPLSVAPDLWLGLADRLTFGVYHSGRAATGFLTGFGTGLCFRGGGSMGACSSGLGDVYTFVGSEARIGVLEGGFALALVLGGQVRAFDPKRVISGKGGFLARFNSRRVALELAPMVYPGITQRKVAGVEFNRDEFAAPVTLFLRLSPAFSLGLQSGVTFVLKKPGDTYRVPVAAGLAWWVSPHFSIDVAFGLAAVADKDDMTKATDQRSASLGVAYAL